jgi:hypothetical protein
MDINVDFKTIEDVIGLKYLLLFRDYVITIECTAFKYLEDN